MAYGRRAVLSGLLASLVTQPARASRTLDRASPPLDPVAPLFAQLSQFRPPSDLTLLKSAGYREIGRGAAQYRRLSIGERPPDWGENLWWSRDGNGQPWLLDEHRPTSDMFGTARDATRGLDGVTTGTDDTQRINALLRYAEERSIGIAILSVGNHRVSDTIRVGQGKSFASVNFMGERPHPAPTLHDSQHAFPSAMLIADRNDRPCINVQAARSSVVSDIVVYGPLRRHVLAFQLGRSDNAPTLVDDADVETWHDAGSMHGYGQYNAGCAFAVDAWSGRQPDGHYPDALYGQPSSSQVSFERCHCAGFTIAFAIKPSDDDSNGDFVRITDGSFSECIYGVSVGNSQSRNVLLSNLNGANFHTALTNRRHGRRIGRFGGPIVNCSFAQCIQLFDIETSRAGTFRIQSGYAEGLWRFGTAIGAGVVDIDGDFMLAGANALGAGMPAWMFPNRGLPMTHFAADDDRETSSRLSLRGSIQCANTLVIAAAFFDYAGQLVSAERAQLYAEAGRLPAWRAAGHNASAGGMIAQRNPYGRSDIRLASSFGVFDLDTGKIVAQADWDGLTWGQSTRSQGCPATARALLPSGATAAVAFPLQPPTIDASALATEIDGRIASLTLHPALRPRASALNLMAGTVISHDRTSLTATIRRYDPVSGIIEALIENGFTLDAKGQAQWRGRRQDLSGGQFAMWSGNFYAARISGTFAAGSNIVNLDGVGDFPIGDTIASDPIDDGVIDPEARIAAVDKCGKSLTLNLPAKRDVQRRPLVLRRGS